MFLFGELKVTSGSTLCAFYLFYFVLFFIFPSLLTRTVNKLQSNPQSIIDKGLDKMLHSIAGAILDSLY